MPISASPYFYNPQMGQIAGNLATAIFGDPEARMKRDYYGSEVQRNQALAGKAGEETRGLHMKNDATANLPSTLSSLFTGPGTPADNFKANISNAAGILTSAGGNANEQTQGLGNLFSQGYAMSPSDDDKRTSMVLQGKNVNDDFAGTTARADTVLKTKGDQKFKQETGVANIKAGADKAVAGINQKGQSDRFFAAPVTVNQGQNAYLAPNDPRYGKVGDASGVVRGNPNAETVRGAAGTKMLAGDTNSSLPGLFNGSGGVAKPGSVPTVNGKSMQDVLSIALANVPGALDMTNPKLPALDANFRASLDPVKLQAAFDAAGHAMQQTRDVNQAGAAFRHALGLQDGDSYQKPGLWAQVAPDILGGGGKGQVVHSPSAGPAAPSDAPLIASPAQLPPPAQRRVGMVINSPKGPVQWNGQGWVPAGPVN